MRSVKVALSVAIIVSLIPYGSEDWSLVADLVFLSIFAVEFAFRLLAVVFPGPPDPRAVAPGRRRLGEFVLLALDLIALASFIPWDVSPEHARMLRLIRLVRILLLIGYWAPLVRDIGTVLARKERLRQIALMGFAVVMLSFCGSVILDAIALQGVDFDGDERLTEADRNFFVRLWWAFRNVQDPGNMLASPLHGLAVVVSLLLTIFGLFLVSFLIGLGTSVVGELVTLGRMRPPGYARHTVLFRVAPSTGPLLVQLLRYYRKVFTIPRYVVVGTGEERPDFLTDQRFGRIVYRHGLVSEPGTLERADTATAHRIVVQADLDHPRPDAQTVSSILMAREENRSAWLVAEVVDESNSAAALVAGGDRTVLVPIERLLALFTSAAAREPSLEHLLRVLLTSYDSEIYTYFYDFPGAELGGPLVPAAPPSFDGLVAAGLRRGREGRVIPLGLVLPAPEGRPTEEYGLIMSAAPAPDDRVEASAVRAVIAVAENFKAVERFGEELADGGLPTEPPPAPARPAPNLELRQRAPHKRVLVCGFRPAAVSFCETLMAADPSVHIDLLVVDEPTRERVREVLQDHRVRLSLAMASGRSVWGCLHGRSAGDYTYRPQGCDEGEGCGRLEICVGDYTTDHVLVDLPGSGGHVADRDLVVFFGDGTRRGDDRTAIAVLKLAELRRQHAEHFSGDFQVVAEVVDPDLGQRLEERYRGSTADAPEQVRVLSSRDLRAFFTFQACVVPAFDAIYTELLGPWGCNFRRLEPAAGVSAERWTFEELALALRARAQTLVAVELAGDQGEPPQLCVCPASGDRGDRFGLDELVAAWVIAPNGI